MVLITIKNGREREHRKIITLQNQIISFQKTWHPYPCIPVPSRPAQKSTTWRGQIFTAGTTSTLYMDAESVTRSGHPETDLFICPFLFYFMEYHG